MQTIKDYSYRSLAVTKMEANSIPLYISNYGYRVWPGYRCAGNLYTFYIHIKDISITWNLDTRIKKHYIEYKGYEMMLWVLKQILYKEEKFHMGWNYDRPIKKLYIDGINTLIPFYFISQLIITNYSLYIDWKYRYMNIFMKLQTKNKEIEEIFLLYRAKLNEKNRDQLNNICINNITEIRLKDKNKKNKVKAVDVEVEREWQKKKQKWSNLFYARDLKQYKIQDLVKQLDKRKKRKKNKKLYLDLEEHSAYWRWRSVELKWKKYNKWYNLLYHKYKKIELKFMLNLMSELKKIGSVEYIISSKYNRKLQNLLSKALKRKNESILIDLVKMLYPFFNEVMTKLCDTLLLCFRKRQKIKNMSFIEALDKKTSNGKEAFDKWKMVLAKIRQKIWCIRGRFYIIKLVKYLNYVNPSKANKKFLFSDKLFLKYYIMYRNKEKMNKSVKYLCYLFEKKYNLKAILNEIVQKNKNASLIANPTDNELNELIANAQIHALPSFNNTGIKLKLINALYNGRHCVVNDEAVEGSGLEDACHIGTTSMAIPSIITQLFYHSFGEEEIGLRKKLLGQIFNNKANARQLIQLIW